MRREQTLRTLLELLDRVHDVQMLRRAAGHLEHLGVGGDLRERPLEACRITSELHRGRVSEVFALAADGELDKAREDRSEDGQHERENEDKRLPAAAAITVVTRPAAADATEPGPA